MYVCLGLLLGTALVAREPEGSVRFEAGWVDRDSWAADAAARHALRLRIEPLVELRHCRLSYELPEGVTFEPLDPGVAHAVEQRGYAGEHRVAELLLGDLRSEHTLRFAVDPAAATDATPIRLTLSGLRVDGREFRTTFNLALVPDDRPAGRLRDGAWEFDAGSAHRNAP